MRVVKSISLPVDLAKKAEQFDNLSLFVQDAIQFGVEQSMIVNQKDRLLLSKINVEYEDLLHEICDIVLTPQKIFPNEKLKKIKDALVKAEWIVIKG